jgi:hypothetical protein
MINRPKASNYSWYAINNHGYVGSPRLTRIKLAKNIELRYDLKKGKAIVLRDKIIETSVDKKINRVNSLKEYFTKFGEGIKSLGKLQEFINQNKKLIISIIR